MPWRFSGTQPQGMMRVYPIPEGLLKPGENQLGIRARIGFGDGWGAMFPGGSGIIMGRVSLMPLDAARRLQRETTLRASVADAVFITLGVVDLLVIVLLLGRARTDVPEFKWLVLTSLLMLLGASGHDLFYILGLNIHSEALLMIALLGVPPSIALYFDAQHGYLREPARQTGIALWGLSALILLTPWGDDNLKRAAWYLYSAIATAAFICALVCAIQGVRERRAAARIQLLALIVYLLSIRTQWLPDVFFGHRNVQIGSLFYRYALLYAYFARVRRIQIDYQQLSRRVATIADAVHASLSRELHDGIGQKLASMKLQLQLAAAPGGDDHLRNLREELDSAIAALRRMLAGLHPLNLDRYGLAPAIRQEAEHIARMQGAAQIETRLENIPLDKETELQLFRIFQEAVGNAIRHGQASRIIVELTANDRLLTLTISDNGAGFDVASQLADQQREGRGLISLRERAALLNGRLLIESHRDRYTKITVTAPIPDR